MATDTSTRTGKETIEKVLALPGFSKFKVPKHTAQRSLDFWSYRRKYYLTQNSRTDVQSQRDLCIFALGDLAFQKIPSTADTPEAIFAVLQARVSKLEENRPQDSVSEITSGKNFSHYLKQLSTIEFEASQGDDIHYEAIVNRLVDSVRRDSVRRVHQGYATHRHSHPC